MMVEIESLERITSDLVYAFSKKVCPASHHLVPLRPFRYAARVEGANYVYVYTLYTGGATTTCT